MIKIPVFKLPKGVESEKVEISKVLEEAIEVRDAYENAEGLSRVLEESCDVIQATLNLMHTVATPDEIELAFASHFLKMKKRGWEFDSVLDVTRN